MKIEPGHLDSTMQTIGNIARATLHEADARSRGLDPLKGHPGRSYDILSHGMPRFNAHVERVAGVTIVPDHLKASLKAEFEKGQQLCESPIERNMLAALLTGDWPMCRSPHPAVHAAKNYDEPFPDNEVVIVPQMALLRFRIDLGLVVKLPGGAPRMLGIECDGKQFHQDVERDRQRYAYFNALGIRMFSISGRVANFEPIAVADVLIDAIAEALTQ